jgi:hypothetical protein
MSSRTLHRCKFDRMTKTRTLRVIGTTVECEVCERAGHSSVLALLEYHPGDDALHAETETIQVHASATRGTFFLRPSVRRSPRQLGRRMTFFPEATTGPVRLECRRCLRVTRPLTAKMLGRRIGSADVEDARVFV